MNQTQEVANVERSSGCPEPLPDETTSGVPPKPRKVRLARQRISSSQKEIRYAAYIQKTVKRSYSLDDCWAATFGHDFVTPNPVPGKVLHALVAGKLQLKDKSFDLFRGRVRVTSEDATVVLHPSDNRLQTLLFV